MTSSFGLALFANSASCSVVVWYFATNDWMLSGILASTSRGCASWIKTSQPLQAFIVASTGFVSPEITIVRSGVSKRYPSPKRKKRRTTPYSEPFSEVTAPNQLWCMDFKGYFATGDGSRCDPFTITDAHSRYVIRCQIVSRMDLSQVRAICEAAMREYGVPARIRTDNGAPD